MFTQKEIDYLKSQRLARIATVGPDGQPDVTPVGFEYADQAFYIGGRDLASTRKYKNVQAGRDKAALVIDDLISVDPWLPRGLRVYGQAELVVREGMLGPGAYLKITPQVSWSWNVEGASMHKTVHSR
jgi:pyridoxamine 5'-phosphate oxidase family protein